MSRDENENQLDKIEARLELSFAFDALEIDQEKRLTGYAWRAMASPYDNADAVEALARIILDDAKPADRDLAEVVACSMKLPLRSERGAIYLRHLAAFALDDDPTMSPAAGYELACVFNRAYLLACTERRRANM